MTTPGARRRRTPALLAVLASLLALVGLGTLAAPSVAEARPGVTAAALAADPDYQRPVVGQCRDYRYQAVLHDAESSSPSACDQDHTALTIAVTTPPRRLDLSDGVSKEVFATFVKTCLNALNDTVGGTVETRLQTTYFFAYFVPTRAQQRHGARWVRCDLVRTGGPGKLKLLGELPAVHLDRHTRTCVDATAKGYLFVTCDHPHDYQSAGVVRLRGAYPSHDAFAAAARRRCPALAGRFWIAFRPNKTYWYYGHDRAFTCYRRTIS